MSQITITVDVFVDEFLREDTVRWWLTEKARNGFACELKTGDRRTQTFDVQITHVHSASPGQEKA